VIYFSRSCLELFKFNSNYVNLYIRRKLRICSNARNKYYIKIQGLRFYIFYIFVSYTCNFILSQISLQTA